MTVETEVNGDSKSTNERGLPWSSCQYKRFLACLGFSSRPRKIIFFLTVHFFNLFAPNAEQVWQAVVPARLSLINVCFWL